MTVSVVGWTGRAIAGALGLTLVVRAHGDSIRRGLHRKWDA